MKKLSFIFFVAVLYSCGSSAQNIAHSSGDVDDRVCVGFYNLENLFDTIVDPDPNKILQEDFTPHGKKQFTSKRYWEKLGNLSKVIADIGIHGTRDGAAVLGVCEIENRGVLEDLVKMPLIKDRDYQIIQYDSPDKRGIDVAFLYQADLFKPETSYVVPYIHPDNKDFRTRDQLVVSGKIGEETFHFVVAHWPSRREGREKTEPNRIAAAELGKSIIDKLNQSGGKVIYMGDLNDDPTNKSLKETFGTEGDLNDVSKGELFNPMDAIYATGRGSLSWRGDWFLFDQFVCSSNLVLENKKGYSFETANVMDIAMLRQASGKYQGTPLRSYGGRKWLHGYSDHFPIYMYLTKNK